MSTLKLSKESYREFQAFLHDACGILLGENKEYLVESRLRPLMEESGMVQLDRFVEALKRDVVVGLREKTIEAMTTNETLWFRDTVPFEILRNQMLPKLVEARRPNVQIWSAACSSGQEPYSISMVIEEMLASGQKMPSVRIAATDISPAMVAQAKEGIYDPICLARGLSDARRKLFFQERDQDHWQVRQDIARRISFSQHNLLQSFSAFGRFDIIFCRNVLIYFSKEGKQNILRRFAEALHADGYLVLGASESITGVTDLFDMVNFRPGLAYQLKARG